MSGGKILSLESARGTVPAERLLERVIEEIRAGQHPPGVKAVLVLATEERDGDIVTRSYLGGGVRNLAEALGILDLGRDHLLAGPNE